MMLGFDMDDVRAFVVAMLELRGESIAPSDVTPDDFTRIVRAIVDSAPMMQRLSIELLGAHCNDAQWAASARVLREVASSPLFAPIGDVVRSVEGLRRDERWCECFRSTLARARAIASNAPRAAVERRPS